MTLTANNPETCNGTDAVTRIVTVEQAAPLLQAMADTLLCGPLDGFELVATSFGTATSFTWSTDPDFGTVLNTSPTDSTAFVNPAVGGTFHVRAGDVPACRSVDSVNVVVSLAEVALERRTGYGWYGHWPQRLLDREYPAWRAALNP